MKNYIPSLNGIRAISVAMVVTYHASMRYLGPGPWDNIPFIFSGELGVSIFFVISGFLITTLLLIEEQETGTISLKNFYIRRAFRIFPLYFTMIGIYAILQLVGILNLKPMSWVTSLTFTKYIFKSGIDFPTAHLWSISMEEHFYIIWPLTFFLLGKHRIKFAILIVVISPLARVIGHAMGVPTTHTLWPLILRGDTLMWGCIFAIYAKPIGAFVERMWNTNRLLILLPIAMIAIADRNVVERIIYMPEVGALDQKYHLRLYLLRMLNTAIGRSYSTLIAVNVGLLILFSINQRDNWWFRFLNSGPMNYIGKLSYSIYIWQQLSLSPQFKWANSIYRSTAMTITLALSSYYLIEKPFLRLKDKFHTSK